MRSACCCQAVTAASGYLNHRVLRLRAPASDGMALLRQPGRRGHLRGPRAGPAKARDGLITVVLPIARVEIVRFCDVTAEHAAAEGEGDRSLESWRLTRWEYYKRELAGTGLVPSSPHRLISPPRPIAMMKVQSTGADLSSTPR